MKKSWIIVISVIAALLIAGMLKNQIIKLSIEKCVEVVTGLKMGIKSLDVGIFRSVVKIEGLKIYNPSKFKDRVMMDMPEIYVDYDLPAIFSGNVHLKDLRLDLKEFVVVKNANGDLNLNSLKVVAAKKEGVKPESKGGQAPNIQIDSFSLKIGRAIYKDYTSSPFPSVREFDVNINEHYTNITNPYALVSIIVVKALMNTAIAGLANFDLSGLQSTVIDSLTKATHITGPAADMARQALQATTRNAPQTMKHAGDAAGDAAKVIGGLFSGAVKSDNK